ncbi:unnamed protein product [Oppiella nova]|uniref:Peptidase M13 N-terminal domain-containing protein n=1 Tax=Oppiella nova TaxID=334625 RepID=A0A7R9QRU7_9ACAR|nr:unnamed protein product [Oppiella nova]CAG2173090.1 unnamed protein product [Oppiella nova]
MTPLIEALKSVGGWPIMGQSCGYNDSEFDWKDAFVKHVMTSKSSPVFVLSVLTDSKDNVVKRIHVGIVYSNFSKPTLGLSRDYHLNPEGYASKIRGYKKYILQSVNLLAANNYNSTQINDDIDSLLEFETKLAQFSDTSIYYKPITFETFNELMNNSVDWLNITNTVYKELNETIRMKINDVVVVEDIYYYINVTQLLTTTPNRVIANYFGWKLVMNLGSHTTKQFRDIRFKFNQLFTGVEKDVELWRSCTASISSQLPYVLSRLYVDKHFTQSDRQEALNYIRDVKKAYYELIGGNDWLDTNTRYRALNKLKNMKEFVGYPDWVLTTHKLDNYYQLKHQLDNS